MKDNTDLSMLSLPQIEAFGLAHAALMLDQARADRADKVAMCEALDKNLQLWVAIKTLVNLDSCQLSEELKENLRRLTEFVADTTFTYGIEIPDGVIDALTRINLQISEGLLEGNDRKE
jgi:flagellar biosynthesis regulator FlaF